MAHKNPVVVSDDGKKHETLGSGDTLAPGSIPISAESGNGLTVKSDGLFAEPGGGGNEGISVVAHDSSLSGSGTDGSPLAVRVSGRSGNSLSVESDGLFAQAGGGGMDEVTTKGTSLTGSGTPDAPLAVVLDPNPANLLRDESGLLVMPQVTKAPVVEFIMDTATRQEVLDRFFLEHDKKQTEAKVIHWVDVTDPLRPNALSSEAYIFIEPTEGGKYMTANGEAFIRTEQPGLLKYWVNDDGSDESVVYQLMDTFRRGDDITVAGDGTNRHGFFSVKLSKKSGNALSIDTENGGLFAETGGGMDGVTIKGTALTGSGTTADPLSVKLDPNPIKLALSASAKNALSVQDDGLYGEAFVIDLPAGTVLTTVTSPGRYRIKGEANGGSSLGFPVPVYSNSEVYMDVVKAQSSSNGGSPIVTQYFYASMLENRPGPYTRMLIKAAWTSWSPLTTEAWVKANMVNWANVSQNGLSLIPVYSTPTFYSYKASDGTAATPEAKTLPSTFDGVVFQLPWAFRKSRTGTFSGVVMAMDANGDLYINIDENYGTNADGETPDAAINWHKFVWVPNDFVPPDILPLDENSSQADIYARVNELTQVLAAAGLVTINSPV